MLHPPRAARMSRILVAAAFPLTMFACAPAPDSAQTTTASEPAESIPYRRSVTLETGEQAVVHGARGDCGKAPPAWSEVRLPEIEYGVFVEGPVGVRRSRACDGPTPARAVIYQALRPGSETFELFGDSVEVRVQ